MGNTHCLDIFTPVLPSKAKVQPARLKLTAFEMSRTVKERFVPFCTRFVPVQRTHISIKPTRNISTLRNFFCIYCNCLTRVSKPRLHVVNAETGHIEATLYKTGMFVLRL